MTSQTTRRIFSHSLRHSLNVYLQNLGSGKLVSCMVWALTLPPFCSLKRLLYLSPESVCVFGQNMGSGKHTSRNPIKIKLRTLVHTDYEAL